MTDSIEDRIRSLGILVPAQTAPLANYVPSVISGNMLFLSGQGPKSPDGKWLVGKVGEGVSIDEAYDRARLAGIAMLGAAKAALGSLDRIKRVVKLVGFVNSGVNFKDHPKVLDGCSDLIVRVFGDAGQHARAVVGVSSLPEDMTIEIDSIFEVDFGRV